MDFTREPIIETVITPKEGCKLVVRSSKANAHEEYFVDAVEVVTFGNAIFFRSTERPKAFIVPASDYEVLEVREARIVLKNVGLDRQIKIGGGREAAVRTAKEPSEERSEPVQMDAPANEQAPAAVRSENGARFEGGRQDRRQGRRRGSRRRRGFNETGGQAETGAPQGEEQAEPIKGDVEEQRIDLVPPQRTSATETEMAETVTTSLLSSLLSPPPLISETISRYKEKFKDAFYTKEEQEAKLSLDQPDASPGLIPEIPLEQPAFGSFEMSEEGEEEIYRQRQRRYSAEEERGDAFPSETETSKKEELKEDEEADAQVTPPDQTQS